MGTRHQTIDVGPSAAHRWAICTASPKFILDHAHELPEDSSVYADEGTLAHEVAKAIILDQPYINPAPPFDMMAHVSAFKKHVMSKYQKGKSQLYVEQRVPLFYLPSRNGIVDAAIRNPDHLYVDDLKYGVGVSVEAEKNDQLALYGESLIRQWELIEEIDPQMPVSLSIFQPRDRNNEEPVRTWVLTRAELGRYTSLLGAAARLALSGNGLFIPSEKGCRFCPAKGICSAYATQGLVALPPAARVITLPNATSLTRPQRIEVLKAKRVLHDWLEAVEDQEMAELLDGAEPAGFKLVAGKSNRVWSDIDAAAKLLSNHLPIDIARPRVDLISPHQAEKALKGTKLSSRFSNKLESLITKPEGKPTLVTEDDPRPPLTLDKEIENIDVI
jgi:hypothetical protein